MIKPVLAFVEVVEDAQGEYVNVNPHWAGVDRANVGGYSFPVKKKDVALRLQTAIESGKIWMAEPQFKTDVDGNTYVCASVKILMRNCSAELKRLGF